MLYYKFFLLYVANAQEGHKQSMASCRRFVVIVIIIIIYILWVIIKTALMYNTPHHRRTRLTSNNSSAKLFNKLKNPDWPADKSWKVPINAEHRYTFPCLCVCVLCLCVVSHSIDKLCVFFGSRIHRCAARQLTQTNKPHGSAVMIRNPLYTSHHSSPACIWTTNKHEVICTETQNRHDTKKKTWYWVHFVGSFHIHTRYLRLGRKGWLTSECVVCSLIYTATHTRHKKKKEEYCSVKH